MPAKFQTGDLVRVGGKGRPMIAAYPWLKRGQVLKVKGIAGRMPGGHIEYLFYSRRGQPEPRIPAYDLRRVHERERAPGAGRPRTKNNVA